MTLGWTDGNTFLPVNSSLLASPKESNLISPIGDFDGHSLAAKRRKLAQMKGTDVMIELLKSAQSSGHHANYVLFDTWFSNPAQLLSVKALGLDSIAMIKEKFTYLLTMSTKENNFLSNRFSAFVRSGVVAANICFL